MSDTERATPIANALQDCLDMRTDGRVPEQYEQLAPQLAPLLQLASVVRELAPQPAPPAFKATLQVRLQRHLAGGSRSWQAQWMWRAAGALLVVMLALSTSVVASASSLPGDALYGVKRAVEDARLRLAVNNRARVGVHLWMAERRLAEIELLIHRRRPLGRTPHDLVSADRAAWLLAQQTGDAGLMTDVALGAASHAERLDELKALAPPDVRPALDSARLELAGTPTQPAATQPAQTPPPHGQTPSPGGLSPTDTLSPAGARPAGRFESPQTPTPVGQSSEASQSQPPAESVSAVTATRPVGVHTIQPQVQPTNTPAVEVTSTSTATPEDYPGPDKPPACRRPPCVRRTPHRPPRPTPLPTATPGLSLSGNAIEVVPVEVLLNGGFELNGEVTGAHWLRATGSASPSNLQELPALATRNVVSQPVLSGRQALRLSQADEQVYQFVPAYEPLAGEITVGGGLLLADGQTHLIVEDGRGQSVAYVLGESPQLPPDSPQVRYIARHVRTGEWVRLRFEVGGDFRSRFGYEPRPRLILRLANGHTPADVTWDELTVSAPMRADSPQALRANILADARALIERYLECCLDDVGPRRSPAVLRKADPRAAGTAQQMGYFNHPMYHAMAAFLQHESDERLEARLVEAAHALIGLRHPSSGLVQGYDAQIDAPVVTQASWPGRDILFLLAVHRVTGDASAFAAAVGLGDAVLGLDARAAQESGYLAPAYDPASGRPIDSSPADQMVGWMEMPAALVELYNASRQTRFLAAAHDSALAYVAKATRLGTEGYGGQTPALEREFAASLSGLLAVYEATEDVALRRYIDARLESVASVRLNSIARGGEVGPQHYLAWEVYARATALQFERSEEWARSLRYAALNAFAGSQNESGAWTDAAFRRWVPLARDGGPPDGLLRGLTRSFEFGGRDGQAMARLSSLLAMTRAAFGRQGAWPPESDPHFGSLESGFGWFEASWPLVTLLDGMLASHPNASVHLPVVLAGARLPATD